jgi:hypothetical protein
MIANAGGTMRTLVASCVVAGLTVAPRPAAGQWGITAGIGVARFGGSSRDTSGITVGPYRPTTFELRVDRRVGPARVAVAVLHAKTGIAGEQPGLAIVRYDLASFWEIAPAVSFRVIRFGTGTTGWIEAGPAIDLWDLDGQHRSRWGGRASLMLEWPLARSLTGSLRAGGVWSGSIFNADDVPAGVERLSTRRFGVGLGLRYQL